MRLNYRYAAAAVAALVALLVVLRVAGVIGPNPDDAVPPSPRMSSAGPGAVVVSRDGRGLLMAEAQVTGRRIAFVIDPQLPVVTLTKRDADRLGLTPPKSAFTIEIRTERGPVRAAAVRLGAVEFRDVVVRDVPAFVMPDEVLGDNMLGLPFLSKLQRYEHREGRLMMIQ